MRLFEYTFPAVRGLQAGREYFVTMCPLELVPRLFHDAEEQLPPAFQAQRVINKARIPEIAGYVSGHAKSYVLSSITASVDADVQFEPLSKPVGPASAGLLRIPMSARLVLHDGLHRCEAIEAALKHRPELCGETISLVLFVDRGLRRAEQIFTDLKRHEIRSARSLIILRDHRDETAKLARAVVSRVPVFTDLTEMVRSKISNRSLKLFTLSGLYHATVILLSDRTADPFAEKLTLATEFWSEVVCHIPDWQRAKAAEVSPAELRRSYVHSHAIALAALARAGKTLMEKYPGSWRRKLRTLRSLDWSRSNTRLWEGRAMIGGRLSKATTCVVLTGNAIKHHLGIPLTADEEEVERRLKART